MWLPSVGWLVPMARAAASRLPWSMAARKARTRDQSKLALFMNAYLFSTFVNCAVAQPLSQFRPSTTGEVHADESTPCLAIDWRRGDRGSHCRRDSDGMQQRPAGRSGAPLARPRRRDRPAALDPGARDPGASFAQPAVVAGRLA